jgi:hypothetical protein
LSRGQLIAGIGGIVLIIAQFLSWADAPIGNASESAFDAFSIMDILMLLVGIAAAGYAAATAMDSAASLPRETPWIVAMLGLLVGGWALGWDLEFDTAGFGAWIALFGCAAIAFGGYAAATGMSPRVAAPRMSGVGGQPASGGPAATPSAGTSEPPPSSPPPGA